MAAVSWQMWANVVIDGGREMDTPLRLLRGERLYSQVYYLYGPVAPLFNALLYRLFGIHLNTLYAAGLAGSLLLVLMILHLGRRFMTTYEAMLAAAAALLLCVFKLSGNTIFPYTYAVLYGTLLGTCALTAQVDHLKTGRSGSLIAAGALSGLALCCKLEFGFAASASLLALVISEPPGRRARVVRIILVSGLIFPILIYGWLLSRIPAASWVKDTFLIPGNIPAELVYFNKTRLGLDDPGKTLRELLSALALLGSAAAAISLAAIRMAGEPILSSGLSPRVRRLWWMMCAGLGWILVHVLLWGTHWDMNPFRALPVLFVGMTYYSVKKQNSRDGTDTPARALLLVSVYCLAVLARVIVRVPAGGAISAGLLPVPLLLFTSMAIANFPMLATSAAAGYHRRRIVLLLLTVALIAILGVLVFRQTHNSYTWLHTPRGNLRQPSPVTWAMNQALEFLARNSSPGEYILALPEGSSLNFLADRLMPLRYEVLTPGFLTDREEGQAIRRIQEKNVRFIFLFNRPTSEFGPRAFGRDYCRTLMRWIDANYAPTVVFGKQASLQAQIGDGSFFIKCYTHKTPAP
jgi:hypothetical protein